MPREIRTILCPLNLRHAAHAHPAYGEALRLARWHGAEVIAATVAPEMERNLNIRDAEGFWTAKLKEFLKNNPAGDVAVRPVVRKGSVHRQIVKLAEDEKTDMIVMEAANPRIQDYLLGTTASHVATHAPCTVMVVR
ncbi:nucleotide-binding universal stress UspA family protein [Rhodovulum imhoffii]|uniref:Nucleotide-binding universal stress UspA family protein n=1 Tax=Rhodovulum imhoffii TaxID=365340 RepID=A0A2T5BS39_9RHOB|nr:universal stress protein [Rhodovulum imhoffii]MBK5934700.1 universal stress protein UspA [Rhodovulum imhoffii]PTN02123.1 nucleotide-binding universal stress UspA family protein [Rhodovulum imhoffii]